MEYGWFQSRLPMRLGVVVGGPEALSSFLAGRVDIGATSIQFMYRAVGTAYLRPKLGAEAGFEMQVGVGA